MIAQEPSFGIVGFDLQVLQILSYDTKYLHFQPYQEAHEAPLLTSLKIH